MYETFPISSFRSMRRFIAVIILLLLFCIPRTSRAQWNWYGQIGYSTDSLLLTTGCLTYNNPGMISGAVRVVRQGILSNTPDFMIVKSDPWGTFTTPPIDWTNYYQIIDRPTCLGTSVFQYNCQGIRIIEINNKGNGEAYAMAGIYNKGVFFATLDAQGNVINSTRWQFPAANNSQKVFISPASDGDTYYICGDYNYTGYVIRVTFNAVSIFANYYSVTSNGLTIFPRAVIEGNGNSQEVVVVGNCVTNVAPCPNGTGSDGMFMRLDLFGNFLSLNAYNFGGPGYDGDEDIQCIKYASQNGGYIVGGLAFGPTTPQIPICCTNTCVPRPNNAAYPLWMALLNVNGSIVWSKLITPATALNPQPPYYWNGITDVVERFNPNTAQYEYYGVHNAQAVFKLDQNGNNTFFPNEFWHSGSNAAMGSNPYGISAIDMINNNPSEDGIITFSPRHEIAKSYFNGVTGCDNSTNMLAVSPGPSLRTNGTVASSPMANTCPIFFSLNKIPNPITVGIHCQSNSIPGVPGGSNARRMTLTSIKDEEKASIRIFPNPVVGKLTIDLEDPQEKINCIEIYDSMNKLVLKLTGTESLELDRMALSEGVYFIKVRSDKGCYNQKILFTEN
jgi:hypothetical protein